MTEIGVDHDRIGPVFSLRRPHPDRAAALEQQLLDRFVEPDVGPELGGHAGHALTERIAPSQRVKHAVFVLEEGQDREQARAAERGHAEIFRLERKRKLQPRILEIARQFLVQRFPRFQVGQDR